MPTRSMRGWQPRRSRRARHRGQRGTNRSLVVEVFVDHRDPVALGRRTGDDRRGKLGRGREGLWPLRAVTDGADEAGVERVASPSGIGDLDRGRGDLKLELIWTG